MTSITRVLLINLNDGIKHFDLSLNGLWLVVITGCLLIFFGFLLYFMNKQFWINKFARIGRLSIFILPTV